MAGVKHTVTDLESSLAAVQNSVEETQHAVTQASEACQANRASSANQEELEALKADAAAHSQAIATLTERSQAADDSLASLSTSLQQCQASLADLSTSVQHLRDLVAEPAAPAQDPVYDDSFINSKLTEIKLKVVILESRLQAVRPSLQVIPTLQADMQTLQTTVQTLRKDMEDTLIKQGAISSQMSVLTEDWDSRQQAVLKEFTLIKTEFDEMVFSTGGSRSKGLFHSKGGEDFADSLAVLREDEKGLKERVVSNSELCSDRFVRLSQQIEAVKVMVTQLQKEVSDKGENQTMKFEGIARDLREEVENLRASSLSGGNGSAVGNE